jgi:hypothetical protein
VTRPRPGPGRKPDAEPTVTYAGLWGAEDLEAADTDGSRGFYCGVARRGRSL